MSAARRSVPQADVAELAGVSVQTVSRVANGLTNVRPETRVRVQRAMEQLGYRPNHAARALKAGRFNAFGVAIADLSGFGSSHLLEAVTVAAAAAGYSLSLVMAGPDYAGAEAAMTRLRNQSVDGIIAIMESVFPGGRSVPVPAGVPMVFANGPSLPGVPFVEVDHRAGARQAVDHLLDLGHVSVAHLSGRTGSYPADEREGGWREALAARGAPKGPVFRGDWNVESGYLLGRRIAADPSITAVFAGNDQLALGLLRACHERGRAVPETLSLVGFDNMAESSAFWPPLTTVEQPFRAMGEASVHALQQSLDGLTDDTPVILQPSIVLRNSTARPYSGRWTE